MFSRSQRTQRWMALIIFITLALIALLGCGTQSADESDPDPNYYKGSDIRRKHTQRP